MAATAASTVPYAVISTTSASGATAFTARSSSWPLIPGIIKSVRTTSAGFSRSAASAAAPVSARCVLYPSRAKIRSSESRFAGSSSTRRRVAGSRPLSDIRYSTVTKRANRSLPSTEKRLDELVRIERLQVRDLLTDPDIADGDLQLVADPDDDAALRRAVELGEDESGDAQRLVELSRLRDRVLARRRVDDEQDLVRRAGMCLLERALDPLELVHQPGLGVEPSGRVAERGVDLLHLRARDGVEEDGSRIAAVLPPHDRHLRSIGPDIELLARRRAERVAGAKDDLPSRLPEPRSELPDRRRLSRSVHPDHHHHLRRSHGGRKIGEPSVPGLACGPARSQGEDALDLLAERRLHLGEVGELAAGEALADGFEQVRRRVDADVRREEDLLQLCEGMLVERLARSEERVQAGDESASRLREPLGEGPSRLRLGELRALGLLRGAVPRFFRFPRFASDLFAAGERLRLRLAARLLLALRDFARLVIEAPLRIGHLPAATLDVGARARIGRRPRPRGGEGRLRRGDVVARAIPPGETLRGERHLQGRYRLSNQS